MVSKFAARLLLVSLILIAVCGQAYCQSPGRDFDGAKWIRHPDSGNAYLRKAVTFDKPVTAFDILITADDSYELWVNSRMIGSGSDWRSPQRYEVNPPTARENSVIAVRTSDTGGSAGLICRVVVRFDDGTAADFASDETWRSIPEAPDGWNGFRFDDSSWQPVRVIGGYPTSPWGFVLPEPWESLQARLTERRLNMAAVTDPGRHPQFSEFKAEYLSPEYAELFRGFVKLSPKTGLLERDRQVFRPFFTIYSQPKQDGGWIINIPEYDYDLLEKDFTAMKAANINVQPRFWNWSELLNTDGTWKEVEKQPHGDRLPYFRYVYEIYDYFLDRAQAHGLYVNVEPSFYWGLHPEVVPPQYRGKILLHDELWDATRDAYAKIMRYYRNRTVIIAVMVGEEDLLFDTCLDEPAMLERYKGFLRRDYGTISGLKRAWRYGYRTDDRSLWAKRTVEGREVMWPEYPFVKGAFDSWASFEDVRLPLFDYYHSPDPPYAPLADMPTSQQNLVRDPMWIDFGRMREGLIISRLNSLADSLREADPNHLLYYCDPFDFMPSWHSIVSFDRARLRWDLIGVGQHDHGFDPSGVPHWASCREYVQNVASYGPYIPVGSAKGFACGEGGGGKSREGVRAYYPWWLTDIVGGGGAFFQSYDWNLIAGRTFDQPEAYDLETLGALGLFLRQIEGVPFTFNPNARVLILRNRDAIFGMSPGVDYGNVRYLASILCQLHIPFDILPDSDVSPGGFDTGKINLSKYSFIFVPAQNQMLSANTWQMLGDWLSDPRAAGRRGLCLGLYQDQDAYFNPCSPESVYPNFVRLTGVAGFSRRIPTSGAVEMQFARYFGKAFKGQALPLQFPDNGEIGLFDSVTPPVESVLELDGNPVVVRNVINGNPVYSCGFYLGMAYDAVWGKEKEQEPYNAIAPLFEGMLLLAGIEPAISAPDNVGVYIADDSSMILVKERFGKRTDFDLSVKKLSVSGFEGATVLRNADGSAVIKGVRVEPYGVTVLRRDDESKAK
ncbi:MAG: hypothetical protein KBC96_04660 [Armatimonadetes bacterium]|nr:hypothetical protein [Armatimonadota bacterium]